MRARAGLALLVAAVLWPAAGCGGSKPEAFRIGILVDCYGPFSTLYQAIVASAELPLLERGGRLIGKQPSSGVEGAEVAGRSAELEIGCVAGNEDVIPEARRLVEENGAQAIVGPLDPQQGIVLREYARTRPETAFLIQPSGAPELTLTDPAPNVFRFASDAAQFVGGARRRTPTDGWAGGRRRSSPTTSRTRWAWRGGLRRRVLRARRPDRRPQRGSRSATDPAAAVPHVPARRRRLSRCLDSRPRLGFVKRYAAVHRDLVAAAGLERARFCTTRA